MTFLQPWLLFALPLVALPVVIHLFNQRRFQTVEWAAMRFLVAARSLAAGMTRLRQWLIMLLRMLAVAAAVLAVSRPLAHGWLAAAGGDRAAAIVLLDRSPSMSQVSRGGGESKLATARRQAAAALETLGVGRVVLIDGATCRPVELATPRALEQVPEAEPAAAAADLPRMLRAACTELSAARTAAGTVWICSDQRANDWRVADPAWPAIRDTLARLPQGVRITLLGYDEPPAGDLAVRVGRAVLEPRGREWDLRLDITLRGNVAGAGRVPVQIELGSARSSLEVELTGVETVVAGHVIPVDVALLVGADAADTGRERPPPGGWGRVSIPADTNPANDEFFFTFGPPADRRSLIVAEEGTGADESRRILEIAAGIPPEKFLRADVQTLPPADVTDVALADVSLVLWQAALPGGPVAETIGRFVAGGGQVVFLPPAAAGVPADPAAAPATVAGLGWGTWSEHDPPLRPTTWRADEGLLAATQDGTSLPVGDVEVRRSRGIVGEGTPLAMLSDGRPLLVRASSDRGGIHFLATTPAARDSDLAARGVVLYSLVQRAITAGLAAGGRLRQVDAGGLLAGVDEQAGLPRGDTGGGTAWQRLAGAAATSTEVGLHAGVYAADGRLAAVNRPAAEDNADVVTEPQLATLFQGLSFTRLERQTGSGGLVDEVWRLFLAAVVLALAVEGVLCLPRRSLAAPARLAATREMPA